MLWTIVAVVAAAAIVAGGVALLGSDDSNSLAAEVDGIRALLGDADPGPDNVEHLGDDCVIDIGEVLERAGVELDDDADIEEAAAYAAEGFDEPFYDCYVGIGTRGYALDAVEVGAGVTVADLEALLDDMADDVEVLDDEIADGDVIEACTDTDVLGFDGSEVEDVFCEYYWTFDGAGLAIIAAAHASLEMDGPEVLDVAVPEYLDALRDAAEG